MPPTAGDAAPFDDDVARYWDSWGWVGRPLIEAFQQESMNQTLNKYLRSSRVRRDWWLPDPSSPKAEATISLFFSCMEEEAPLISSLKSSTAVFMRRRPHSLHIHTYIHTYTQSRIFQAANPGIKYLYNSTRNC